MSVPRSKYGAQPIVIDGICFASRHEARVYEAHVLELRAGVIRDLRWQVRYPLVVANLETGELTEVAVYVADFVFVEVATGATVVEDAKGVVTPVYALKKRLMEALYGIRIREVRARR